MNAIMPGNTPPQFETYGGGIATDDRGINPLPVNAHHGSDNGQGNSNGNSNGQEINNNNNNNNNTNTIGDNPGERSSGVNTGPDANHQQQQQQQPSTMTMTTATTTTSIRTQSSTIPPEYLNTQTGSEKAPEPPKSTLSLTSDPHPFPESHPHRFSYQQQSSQSHSQSQSQSNSFTAGAPMSPPRPFPLGSPDPTPIHDFHSPENESHPWSIGSTDGSIAIIHLENHLEARLQNLKTRLQKQEEDLEELRRQALSKKHQAVPESNNIINDMYSETSPGDDAQPGPSGPDGTGGPVGEATATAATSTTTESNDHTIKPIPAAVAAAAVEAMEAEEARIATLVADVRSGRSLFHDRLFNQSSSSVEGVLAAVCDIMGFDIAEMWLRTGPKTHQLTNSHLRPTALQDSVRQDLVEVYYGEKSNERTHRLSPALCKRAKDANDVVWVTAHTQNGAEALRMSISNVRTAVAVPVCHDASNSNVTIIYFSIRRIMLRPAAVEFLVHMSLSAAVTSVNALSTDGLIDRVGSNDVNSNNKAGILSRSSNAVGGGDAYRNSALSKTTDGRRSKYDVHANRPSSSNISYQRANKTSITGARLDLQWRQLLNVEYLTDGGNSWIHTAIFDGKPVVVKTLRPECLDTAVAINEIESEVAVHSRLNHPNIVSLIGAGWTSKKDRFIVLERLDGGTLTQQLGYDTRIRDRRRRFWRKKQLPYLDVLRCARSLACAMQYCHEQAVPGSMVLHRDLKPDNIGFTLDGQVKLLDFGLARMLENSDPKSNDRYQMSGETGSLRYMAPEVADGFPYNHKADVYSFGIIFWEMNAGKRPFGGLDRDTFYEQVVHEGVRPHLSKRWPSELTTLMSDCWNVDVDSRPTFGEIVDRIDDLLTNEKGGSSNTAAKTGKKMAKRLTGIIDRHSTWF